MGSKKDKTTVEGALVECVETKDAVGAAGAESAESTEYAAQDTALSDEMVSADELGPKFSRRKFVLGAAVAGGVVAIGAAGTASALLLYGQSEGASKTEEASAGDVAPGRTTTTTKLPDAATPRAAAADAADKAADKDDEAADAAQDSPSTENGGGSSGTGGASGTSAGGGSNAAGGGGSSGSGTGSGGGSSSGGGGSTPKKKWHEGWNEWVVDTPGHWETTIEHRDAVYYDKPVYGQKCWDCGFVTTSPDEMYAHLDQTGHRGYATAQIGTKRELVTPAEDKEIKTWVDEKGHNVWHEGYWE